MMDISLSWKKIQSLIKKGKRGKKTKKGQTPKTILRDMVERRNEIVHGGDLYDGKKFHGKLKGITRTWVVRCLKNLKSIVASIEVLSQD